MSLSQLLRARLRDPQAASFQLQNEDLWLLSGADLSAAAGAYAEALERAVPGALRGRFEAEQRAFLSWAHGWLRRYNRDIHRRLEGYVALGRLCHFEYPWPVVAMLGLCAVLDGMSTMRLYGLLGRAAGRLGLPLIERVSEGLDDVLRRTNRGIFADSVPLVLLAVRCHALRARGEAALAEALLTGPPPPLLDEHAQALARRLSLALAEEEPEARFHLLASLTEQQFAREQAVFTHQLGLRPGRQPAAYASTIEGLISNPRRVTAPSVANGWRGRRVVFRARPLPAGFDMRDHHRRVEVFSELFVRSVTACPGDYRAALTYSLGRFGGRGDRPRLDLPQGGTPPPRADDWGPAAA